MAASRCSPEQPRPDAVLAKLEGAYPLPLLLGSYPITPASDILHAVASEPVI
jgi:hypothetical protein